MHAFGDDALGDLDAVGLVDALNVRSGRPGRGRRGRDRPHRGRQPAAERLGVRGFRPGAGPGGARRPCGGFFGGVPTFIKDNVDVAGHADDAAAPTRGRRGRADADSEFARMYLATGLTPLGKTQMSEYGFSASAEHPRLGPVRNPWNTDYTAGASSSGSARVRGRRCGADRARQRRRRFDPNSGVLQRTRRAEAVAWPATAGQRSQPGCRFASSPTGWSADRCATPPRSTGKPSGSGATPSSRRSETCTHAGHAAAADRGLHPLTSARVQPGDSRADVEVGGLLEELGHRVDQLDNSGA